MSKQMLIDTTHAEETRVVVLDGNRLEDYDVETSSKKQLKGNIYLAKVVRVEPSLQAAFVEYGGNRHGFLAFGEIHPDYYQIPVADRERLIALQEEEARAEEAREEAEETTGGPECSAPESSGPEAGHPYSGAGDATGSAHDSLADHQASQGDEPGTHAEDAPSEADGRTARPDELEPETVNGEAESEERRPSALSARFLRQYKIQEVIRRRQILLVQVVKEERGNKGAALTTYISLAGRFSVLMPNSPKGGGVSRKITSAADRKRLKEITAELDLPRGMAMIVRTAGAQRPRPEIKRDGEYLLSLWDEIREQTLKSVAPALIYEEANLIKRAIRDVYTRDVEQIVVDGETGWKAAREFMRNLMPANAGKVRLWRDHGQPLFAHHQVEHHLDAMLQPNVQLRSGGYLVINQTEALVAIDVNSGRSTRERGIEETALRTNLEAADEVARQLRLRDLAGLIVIDFIDMESRRHNAMVERRLKDALRNDRARIQVGSISSFGLLEMSRQRLRPSLAESSFVACPHCSGTGFVRGIESSALHVLRAVEEEGAKQRAGEILVHVATPIALYILNQKRTWLSEIERRHNMIVGFAADDSLIPPQSRIDKLRPQTAPTQPAVQVAEIVAPRVADVAAERRLPANGIISHSTDPFASSAADSDFEADADVGTSAEPGAATEAEAAAGAEDSHEPQPTSVEARAPAEGSEEERRRKRRRRRRRGGRRDEAEGAQHGEADPAEIQHAAGGIPSTGEPVEVIEVTSFIEAPGTGAPSPGGSGPHVDSAPAAAALGSESVIEPFAAAASPASPAPQSEATGSLDADQAVPALATGAPGTPARSRRRARRPAATAGSDGLAPAQPAVAALGQSPDEVAAALAETGIDAEAGSAAPLPAAEEPGATTIAAKPRRRRTAKPKAGSAPGPAPGSLLDSSPAPASGLMPESVPEPMPESMLASVPESAPGAAGDEAPAKPARRIRTRKPAAPAPDEPDAGPTAPASSGDAADPAVAQARTSDQPSPSNPVVQPILVDSPTAPPARRTGWWRR